MDAMASQITSLTIVYSTVYYGIDQRKHQSSGVICFHLMTSSWTIGNVMTWKRFPHYWLFAGGFPHKGQSCWNVVFSCLNRLLRELIFELLVIWDTWWSWASYQIGKIAGCACTGNAGNHYAKLSRAMQAPWVDRFLNNEIYCYPSSKKRCRPLLRSPPARRSEGIVTSGRQQRSGFPRHRLQRKPLVSDTGMYHGTCVTCRASLTCRDDFRDR